MKLVAKVANHILDRDSVATINNHILKMKDGEYAIEIKRHYKNRTIPQNRLMWDIYNQVSEQTGYETEEIHAMMGQKFLIDDSKKIPFVKSTTSLTTVEFTEYIDKIVRFFTGECSFIIKMPDDY